MTVRTVRPLLVAALAVLLVTTADPAAAGKGGYDPEVLVDSGSLSYSVDPDGTVTLTGPGEAWFRKDRTGRPVDIDARLATADGTLPAPGACEPATASFSVTGERRSALELEGAGTVCGQWTDQTSIVTQVFTGRYDVTSAGRKKLIGTDGFFEIRLTAAGTGHAFAVDT